jgi:hypothetical protein
MMAAYRKKRGAEKQQQERDSRKEPRVNNPPVRSAQIVRRIAMFACGQLIAGT